MNGNVRQPTNPQTTGCRAVNAGLRYTRAMAGSGLPNAGHSTLTWIQQPGPKTAAPQVGRGSGLRPHVEGDEAPIGPRLPPAGA